MINTEAFSYINVLSSAANASWLRNEAISNNIANATTPGYKRQDVAFEDALARELHGASARNMDSHVAAVSLRRLNVGTYTDAASFSYRTDGNNVDIENENVFLAQNQLKYMGLLNSISSEFENLQNAMK